MTGRRGHGFTLIEMLVVIAIISILVGLLMPVLHKVRMIGLRVGARYTLSNLQTAIEQYCRDLGDYPPDDYRGSDQPNSDLDNPAECLVYFLADQTDYYGFKKQDLIDLDGDNYEAVVDSWGQPFVYNRRAFSGTDGYNRYGDPRHNVNDYDLFSIGEDGETGGTRPRPLYTAGGGIAPFFADCTNSDKDGTDEDDLNNFAH